MRTPTWVCQPENAWPSYSIPRAILIGANRRVERLKGCGGKCAASAGGWAAPDATARSAFF
ncbi:MAG: hypothetical protein HY749_07025 [Gammaproteobacteria bacterium]|nr:hypothetical protein [Gammaproteobacteria bacterium]